MKVITGFFCKSLGHFNMLTAKGIMKRCFLESGLNQCLTFYNFRNKVTMTNIFFSKCLKLIEIPEMEVKNEKNLFSLKLIAFELGQQILTIPNRILVIGSQCGAKHL